MKIDASTLVEEFVESLLNQRQAIKTGTKKGAKYYGNKCAPIARKLLRMGDEGKREFATLLHHPDRQIRVTAAVYSFSSLPEETLAALKEIAKGDDFAAYCAELRIKEWEEHPEHYDESHWV